MAASKGEHTRDLIVEHALRSASVLGLDALTLGELSRELKLSKSGLFAHFGSKEQLQLSVLAAAAQRFANAVVLPAIRQPKGEPRVRAMFENWLVWSQSEDMPGGCVFIAASAEFDSRPGAIRDYIVRLQEQALAAISKAASLASEVGHFHSDLDVDGFAFEFQGVLFAAHHHCRLLRSSGWERRARHAFERLIESSRAPDRKA